MTLDPVLFLNSLASGLLLGAFYALAASGLAVAFGLLDVVNIAHPAIMVAAAFSVSALTEATGLDPALATVIVSAPFALAGAALYRVYHYFFKRRNDESIQGLAFFFGLMFLVETALLMIWGADQRFVETSYTSGVVSLGEVDFPVRMIVPAAVALVTFAALIVFLKASFIGRAIAAVSQDSEALRLMGVDPVRVKTIAFAISTALAAVAGGLLILIQPVNSASGRIFIGRLFAIVIIGGLGSLPGTLIAGLLFGVVEDITATLLGPSWSPAVAFGLLLGFLALRPRGLLGAGA
ncbi:MAG TPA: branched-chain amino acid ABC transporter permease [Roseiarcus sp.]